MQLISLIDAETIKSSQGNQDSFHLLFSVAMQAIKGMLTTKKKQLSLVNEMAKQSPIWPIWWMHNKKSNKIMFDSQISGLDFGAESKEHITTIIPGKEPRHNIANGLYMLILAIKKGVEWSCQISALQAYYEKEMALLGKRYKNDSQLYKAFCEKQSARFDYMRDGLNLVYEEQKNIYNALILMLGVTGGPFEPIREQISKDCVSLPELSDPSSTV